jgi:hypothetical protein
MRLNDTAAARELIGPVLARSTSEAERERARQLLAVLTESSANSNSPLLRRVEPGEQRVYGTFEGVQCTGAEAVLLVQTADGLLRARAKTLSDVHFISYRRGVLSSVGCGAQERPVEAFLTWRVAPDTTTAGEGTAVAVEFLPEGFAP